MDENQANNRYINEQNNNNYQSDKNHQWFVKIENYFFHIILMQICYNKSHVNIPNELRKELIKVIRGRRWKKKVIYRATIAIG